ncbi:amidohydrolase family protein [Streptomyces xanthophaeus]|uniref:amidohydrolase family protein n=1 Tax=Streptomyces xanthophaeus TaxID=67385 RepID=UPI003430B06A
MPRRLGEERGRRQYPFGALHAAGAVLAAGSDWFVSSPDPWHGIHVAVNRQVWAEELGEPDLRPPSCPSSGSPLPTPSPRTRPARRG